MRVLIADKFEQSGRDGLDAAGCEFSYQPDVKDESLVEAVRSYQPDVLVVRGTKVSEGMLDAGALKLIVRAGAGFNTIDVAAASRRGVYVSNCPGKNSVAVAELAFALILALDRRIPDNVIQLRAGQWNKKEFSKARGLLGRTLGLIGTGQIGREMVARARGFGMPVIAWSRSLTEEGAAELGVERRESLRDVARDSDIVSVHVALKTETRGLIDRDFFDAMREGAYFINTSRGEVVDEEALRRAMRERSVRAGLDVFAAEPAGATGEFTDEIALEPNLYGTHHIGASTDQAQEAIAAETVRIIKTFKETGRVPNVVNLARRTPATHTLVVRHRDRPGVLASVLDSIRLASINVQEMENIIFEGSEAAVARINLESALPSDVLERLKTDNADIIELSLLEIKS
ncbi:MAG: D-3-phosphoglycerate dehydrogenase / 2-oxoglutarate reductase [Acidobacteriota bacterium]|jgi:D-3-phosphoglycerate dehydrogenase|nr:D-3-phosphoglycerate dehydrogenase / 2-oxoglutarate reductase [Acidobacteriota bacterium]